MYLLELSYVNPMPAHYYNQDKKELIFDESEEYGVDLEEKDGYIRDGFNISEEYFLSLVESIQLHAIVRDTHKEKVTTFLKKKYILELNTICVGNEQGLF